MLKKLDWGKLVVYSALVLFSLLYLMPIYMTIITALKHPVNISLTTAWQPPVDINWGSFAEAYGKLGPNFMNSLYLASSATIISAIIGSLNGYVFSKWELPGNELIFTLVLFGMFIPYQIILIPLFRVLRQLGLYGGITGLALAHIVYGIPITSLIFRNFYARIPKSMIESAQMDGAGFFGIYRRIMLPLSAPGFVVVVIWQFTQIWNEFLWGITLTRHSANPITVGLAQLAGGQAVSWNLPMAGSLLAAFPVLIIYILMGRYFIKGLLAGSVKG
ncbi:MAG: carbohydrate ABC transporter permease [Candidatus Bipolaricaulota bacterium]